MTTNVVRVIPSFMKPALKSLYYLPLDFIDRLQRRDSLIPPRSLIFVGGGDFESIGQEFKQYFIDLADLKPDECILDVGCGIGRMAVPLTSYLSSEGRYHGFDIVKKGIAWCQTHISSRFVNFSFQHVDVFNANYNPRGSIQAKELRLPFPAEFFDFVFLTSVFTHMMPADLENYLSEISRVLKQGGRCLITFFLLNEESAALIASGRSALDFRFEMDEFRVIDSNNPEAAIAFKEDFITGLFARNGLSVALPIHYGSWCKREQFLSYQDVVLAKKPGSSRASG
jgi:SAM-dependent methyltransferase